MSYNKLRIDIRYKGGSSHHVKLFQINERASLPFSLFLAVYIRGDIRLLLINDARRGERSRKTAGLIARNQIGGN